MIRECQKYPIKQIFIDDWDRFPYPNIIPVLRESERVINCGNSDI